MSYFRLGNSSSPLIFFLVLPLALLRTSLGESAKPRLIFDQLRL